MTYLRSLLLIACCCLASFAQAQDGELYAITRWHLQPDALPDFVTEMAKFNAVYSENVDFDWSFHAYDDNTVEVVSPIRNYADMDRMDAAFNLSRSMIPEEKMKAMYDPAKMQKMITKVETDVVKTMPEMSYTPAGEEGLTGMKASVLYRHRTSFGSGDQVEEHGKKLVEMMKKVKSPAHMTFYVYEMGDGQVFEAVYSGKDRADLDRRMAEQEKLMAGPEADAWSKIAMELAPMEHSTYATEIEELGHRKAPSTTSLFAVQSNSLKPGKADTYVAMVAKMNKHLRAGGADFYWTGSLLSDDRVMYFAPIQTMSDLDGINEAFAKRSYQLTPEQQQEVGTAFYGLTSGQETWVSARHDDLGFLPQERYDADYKVYKAVTYEYDPSDEAKVNAFLKNTKVLAEKAGTKSPYEVWSYQFGGPTNQIVVVDWGKDKASIDARMAADMKLMDAAWVTQLTSLLTEVKMYYGETMQELSFLPEGK
jgi:hypothetical protein